MTLLVDELLRDALSGLALLGMVRELLAPFPIGPQAENQSAGDIC